jgi:branched-chain amino acid transport system substrate-binding protein
MKKSRLILILSALVILVVTIIIYCNLNKVEKPNGSIKIAVVLPLSGNMAKIGVPKKNAFELAALDINSIVNNKRIEFEYEDSKGTPKDGLSAFQKLLIDKSNQYFYIDLTPVVDACIPIINKNKVITFIGSAQAEVTERSDYLYRIFAGGEQEIELIVNHLISINKPKIFILHTNELYGKTANDHLRELYSSIDGKIIGSDEYPVSQKDFKDIINKINQTNFDNLVILGYGLEFPSLLKQLNETKFPLEKIVMNLGATNAQVVALGPQFTDGITFVGPRFTYLLENNQLNEKMANFVNKYKAKFNEVPDFRAAYAYDFVTILYDAISKANSNSIDIVGETIIETRNYDGVSGKISFKANRDSHTDLVLAKYKEGKMVLVHEIE